MSDNQARLRELSLLMPAIQYIQKWSNAKTAEYVTAIESAFKAQATVEKCREAGFVDEKGNIVHIPKNSVPTRTDADNLFDYVEWFGPQHLAHCSEDDTCNCDGRPVNESVKKCLLFVKHFTGGQAAERAKGVGDA